MSRSEQGVPTQPPLALSAERLDVTLLLIGSEPGPHDVLLLGAGDQVLARASGQAEIRVDMVEGARTEMSYYNYVVVLLCTSFAFVLVLLHYGVTEALSRDRLSGRSIQRMNKVIDARSYKM